MSKRLRSAFIWLLDIILPVTPHATHLLVRDGERRGLWKLYALITVRAMLYMLVLVLAPKANLPLWAALFSGLVGVTWIAAPIISARLYVHAWTDGRADMLHRIQDEQGILKGLEGAIYHDAVHVLGLKPPVPDSPEGLDD